ncbi:toll-like receptor 13 [Mytilus californianus]|uniref:toll-like receptor 13 n=1 Tax=Mytilus californianus TaxID=6549 RepID=UPI0022453156|nr:toll-like receptor 13 [Mytilus californianus]
MTHLRRTNQNSWENATCSLLHYIPALPRNIAKLTLKNNTLTLINQSVFSNISSIKLKTLCFENNSIETIEDDAFSDFKVLTELNITDEKLLNVTSLKYSFKSLPFTTIKKLCLEKNDWNELPQDMFNFLSKANIFMSLKNNLLTELKSSVFLPIRNLQTLRIEENEIVFVDLNGLSTTELLDLSNNNIYSIPIFCKNTNKTFVPQLKYLSLAYNSIRKFSKESFRCLGNLKNLNLDGNRIRSLGDNVFGLLYDLKRLSIGDNQHLRHIDSFAFSSSSLEVLRLHRNHFRFIERKFKKGVSNASIIFRTIPNLKELDLSKNHLTDFVILRKLFSSTRNIRKLNLASTGIKTIPDGFFQKMPHIEWLTLHGNELELLKQSIFENVSSMRELYLDGNNIHVINEKSFPSYLLKSLDVLELSGNQFQCTCEIKWFLDTIRSTNLSIKLKKNWPKYYICHYPDNLKKSLLADYFPTTAECNPLNILSMIIITACSSVLILLVCVILTFNCQINIKNAVYLFRLKQRIKNGYFSLESSDDFEFDAFVVYCDADRLWVHGVLLKHLENSNLNICVHHRDFDVGDTIMNNIGKYMAKSWKIIVVLSNNFAKSEWCQWEIDLVQERRRRQGKEVLILLMYQQIDSKHMTTPLRTLLETTPYLSYKEGFGEYLFWTAVMKDTNKPLNIPPTSIF